MYKCENSRLKLPTFICFLDAVPCLTLRLLRGSICTDAEHSRATAGEQQDNWGQFCRRTTALQPPWMELGHEWCNEGEARTGTITYD